jgi:regulator of sigma E protease
MQIAQLILHNLASFIIIISLIVFIHEFGHFYVARLCGVKVDEFSIGFGRELFGFNDKKGTRWKFCLLPFGGYVKMYGDKNGASIPDHELVKKMSAEERQISFIGKNVYQRMAIVAAGPIANFLLAIVIFTFLFKLNGAATVLPIVSDVVKDGPASVAGFKQGDEILAINNKSVSDFDEVKAYVVTSFEEELVFQIRRSGKIIELKTKPQIQLRKDFFGEDVKIRTIGIIAAEVSQQELNLLQSFTRANYETYRLSTAIFKFLGELVTGKRDVSELGGPIKIAKYSGKTVEMGFLVVLWFMAMISVNLGVVNLLPIPALDGGHLFYYLVEAIRRKPLSMTVQNFGFRIGMSLVLLLMVFVTLNDIRQLFF